VFVQKKKEKGNEIRRDELFAESFFLYFGGVSFGKDPVT